MNYQGNALIPSEPVEGTSSAEASTESNSNKDMVI